MSAKVNGLRFNLTASVFRKKVNLTKASVLILFDKAAYNRSKRFILKKVRKPITIDEQECFYSIIVYKYEELSSFLSSVKNHLHAFLLLIEIGNYVFVFKENVKQVNKLLSKTLEKLTHQEICTVGRSEEQIFEAISLKAFSSGRHSVRTKKIEAGDLTKSMSLQGTNRQIVNNLKKRRGDYTFSLTVPSSRVSCSASRVGLREVCEWAMMIAQELDADVELDHFLMNFASPVSYEEEKKNLVPTGVHISLSGLEESKECEVQFSGKDSKQYTVSQSFRGKLFSLGKETFSVVDRDGKYFAEYDGHPLFQVKMNSKSLTVGGYWLKRIMVKEGDRERCLADYIKQNNLLQVNFENPKLLYTNQSLYKDEKVIGDIEGFLTEFISFEELAKVKSEKGTFSPDQIEFSNDSLFHFVENVLAGHNSYLVCDDLGDEWADHLGFSLGNEDHDAAITFYISKHKPKLTTSASAFHDVVGQAVKNMAKLFVAVEDIEAKYAGIWSQCYQGNGVVTSIPRIRKCEGSFVEDFERAISLPNVRRELYLVVDFISKSDLHNVLQKLANGEAQKPHYTQLIWMLSSFINVSREMGVIPKVVCQP